MSAPARSVPEAWGSGELTRPLPSALHLQEGARSHSCNQKSSDTGEPGRHPTHGAETWGSLDATPTRGRDTETPGGHPNTGQRHGGAWRPPHCVGSIGPQSNTASAPFWGLPSRTTGSFGWWGALPPPRPLPPSPQDLGQPPTQLPFSCTALPQLHIATSQGWGPAESPPTAACPTNQVPPAVTEPRPAGTESLSLPQIANNTHTA